MKKCVNDEAVITEVGHRSSRPQHSKSQVKLYSALCGVIKCCDTLPTITEKMESFLKIWVNFNVFKNMFKKIGNELKKAYKYFEKKSC